MEKIVALCKRRGFIFQSSEIYGGLNGAWDYGPLGVELKRNLKDYWWKSMTQLRDDIVGFDGSILMNAAVWKASGHVDTFSDPLVECMLTKKRYRADQIEPQSGTAYFFKGYKDRTAQKAAQQQFTQEKGQISQAEYADIEAKIEAPLVSLPFSVLAIKARILGMPKSVRCNFTRAESQFVPWLSQFSLMFLRQKRRTRLPSTPKTVRN